MCRSLLQIAQQIEHLGLHRDIERGGGLVGDDQVGVGQMTAPAISTRWAMPPDTSCG